MGEDKILTENILVQGNQNIFLYICHWRRGALPNNYRYCEREGATVLYVYSAVYVWYSTVKSSTNNHYRKSIRASDRGLWGKRGTEAPYLVTATRVKARWFSNSWTKCCWHKVDKSPEVERQKMEWPGLGGGGGGCIKKQKNICWHDSLALIS